MQFRFAFLCRFPVLRWNKIKAQIFGGDHRVKTPVDELPACKVRMQLSFIAAPVKRKSFVRIPSSRSVSTITNAQNPDFAQRHGLLELRMPSNQAALALKELRKSGQIPDRTNDRDAVLFDRLDIESIAGKMFAEHGELRGSERI